MKATTMSYKNCVLTLRKMGITLKITIAVLLVNLIKLGSLLLEWGKGIVVEIARESEDQFKSLHYKTAEKHKCVVCNMEEPCSYQEGMGWVCNDGGKCHDNDNPEASDSNLPF